MKLVWSKSNQPFSLLIRAVTGEPSSHFSFVFETAAKGVQFESNLLGTHPKFWANSQKKISVVHEIDIPLPIEIEDKIWDLVVERYDGKPYDFGGAAYLGWRKLLKRWFNLPIPTTNKWARDNHFFCNEIYEVFNAIPGFVGIPCTSMDSPEDVWLKLKDWQYGGNQ